MPETLDVHLELWVWKLKETLDVHLCPLSSVRSPTATTDEDVETEEHGGINPRIFDSRKFPTIDSLDDDSDIELDGNDYL